MKRLVAIAAVMALFALGTSPGMAQEGDELRALREEIQALKQEQAKLRAELQVIVEFLRGRLATGPAPDPPENLALGLGDDPTKGSKAARLVLVEFTDYECPFCARYFHDTLPQLEKEYIQTGKLRYVLREFPLESIHPQAFKAAEAALCAGEQGKYWEMHDRLFSNQQALGPGDLVAHAQAVGLDAAEFQQCLDSGRTAAKVRKDFAEGRQAGVGGTPTFFLGTVDDTGSSMKVLTVITGARPFSSFKAAIDRALSAPK